jgi:hypothetical protein
MRHLNLVFNSGAARNIECRSTPFRLNGSPKLCWGCQKPFPVRDGRREAQVGQDGRLYCYHQTLECMLLAIRPAA